MIKIRCGSCSTKYFLRSEMVGRKVRCRTCGKAIRIPDSTGSGSSQQQVGTRKRPPQSKPPNRYTDLETQDFESPAESTLDKIRAIPILPRRQTVLPARTVTRSEQDQAPEELEILADYYPNRGSLLIAGLFIFGMFVMLLGLGFFIPILADVVGRIMTFFGLGEVLIGVIWLLVAAFDEDHLCFWLMVVFPPYIIYFMITRLEDTKWIFLLWLTGPPIALFGAVYFNVLGG